ncbi:MAG: hypothetical protein A3F09_00805 [Chlamydiae bacterium RIFCSPHIGHO2_12_FULL_49_11]|nr:MAG: hypothetical protein A3F09_00805 [Chlamydiae bacterium RIFCSPHIGHO2_12_FULL_49_11]
MDKLQEKVYLYTSTVAAGFAKPAEEGAEGPLDLNEHLIRHPAATFFVRVEGHSMQGAGIFSGDMLIVDRAKEAKTGAVILAVLGGEFTVKRLVRNGKRVGLQAEHPDFPIVWVHDRDDFAVWGVVTYVIHSL